MNKNTFLKGFLPFASATLLLSSCSEDKTVPGDNDGQAIVFRVQNALPSSRAAGTTAGYMDAFVINGVVDNAEKSSRILFDQTTVSRVIGSGANVFTYSPAKYYPKGATKAWFSAFSPVSSRIEKSDFQISNNNPLPWSDNRITYTVPSPDVAPQEDLLVAHTQKGDLSGAVVLQFRHALSRVSVKAVNLIDQPVRIHSLSLHNLYTTGTLDIDGKSYDDGALPDDVSINEEYITPKDADGHRHADYKVLWETVGQPNKALAWQLAESGIMVPVGSSPVQVTADDQALLVLPQTTINTDGDADPDTDTDFYLEVTYTVGKITETIQAAFNDINRLTPDNNQGLTFEMGRQYAINVSITATGLSFGLEVNNWDEPPATQFVVTYDDNMGRRIAQTVWTTEQNYKAAAGNLFTSPPVTGMNIYFWNTQKDGAGDTYMPGAMIPVTGDMTLYARWRGDFSPTATTENITISMTGKYKLEAWGAQGYSNGGRGGYASTAFSFKVGQELYVRVGKQTGFNGGGGRGKPDVVAYPTNLVAFDPDSDWGTGQPINSKCSGGGATDFRISPTTPLTGILGTDPRILVAGGGGGSSGCGGSPPSGAGGGVSTANVLNDAGRYAWGATFTTAGYLAFDQTGTVASNDQTGTCGVGGVGYGQGTVGNGGGGWWGGSGGFGFIGWQHCWTPPGSGGSGYAPLGGQNIRGDESFIQPNGSTAIGKSGDGYARITYLGQ